MRKFLFFVFLILLAAGCRRSYDPVNRNPVQLRMAEQAAELEAEIVQFQKEAPEPLRPELDGLVESAVRFNNQSQRFAPGSLEARSAFDKLRFNATQADPKVAEVPELTDRWVKIRSDIREIAAQLGYKVDVSASR